MIPSLFSNQLSKYCKFGTKVLSFLLQNIAGLNSNVHRWKVGLLFRFQPELERGLKDLVTIVFHN